jgi:hypothetical protein
MVLHAQEESGTKGARGATNSAASDGGMVRTARKKGNQSNAKMMLHSG